MDSLIKAQHDAATQQMARKVPKGKPSMTISDDSVMLKRIEATHSPDAREVEVKLLLGVVEDILNRATLLDITATGSGKLLDTVEDKLQQAHVMNILDTVSYAIDRVACEICYKALSGSDAHETTMAILELLTNYRWDAKLVLTLAAFAMSYGEFWLLLQIYSSNQLAKSLAMLRLLPTVLEHSAALKSKFEALNSLIREMMNVARCVADFRELPQTYISLDVSELSTAMANIPIAVYWTIRSVIACIAQITMITTMGHELVHTPSESWELSTLANKLKNIREHLSERLRVCNQHIEAKKSDEALRMLYQLFGATTHIDNMKVLKALIYAKDDILPLVDGASPSKKRVDLNVLRRKSVLLLISDFNISQEELSILEHIYTESRKNLARPQREHMPYEVVWLPIVDPTIDYDRSPYFQKKFETLQSTMPWYSVYHPRIIQKHVAQFIRERWHFRSKPILVVLDPQGSEASLNALHMMWIWGSSAYPFTKVQEEALWSGETWKLELLIDGIDQTILDWLRREDYIFLYGGDDMEWIRKFTTAARGVARDNNINLQMLYVGKRHHSHREKIKRIADQITTEKLSYCWTDPAMMWFFWTRIESMLYSKIQLNKADVHDEVMQGIKKLLSYDKVGSWAVLSKGAEIILTTHGAITTVLTVYDTTWKKDVPSKGFRQSLLDYYTLAVGDIGHPCCHFDFHVTAGSGIIPERMKCAECHRPMEKYITFSCCHEDKKDLEEEEFNF